VIAIAVGEEIPDEGRTNCPTSIVSSIGGGENGNAMPVVAIS
jgi:hypothetical protein